MYVHRIDYSTIKVQIERNNSKGKCDDKLEDGKTETLNGKIKKDFKLVGIWKVGCGVVERISSLRSSSISSFHEWSCYVFHSWDCNGNASHGWHVVFEQCGLLKQLSLDFGCGFLNFNFLNGFNGTSNHDTTGGNALTSLKRRISQSISNLSK